MLGNENDENDNIVATETIHHQRSIADIIVWQWADAPQKKTSKYFLNVQFRRSLFRKQTDHYSYSSSGKIKRLLLLDGNKER